nr:dof zinc finger protein DOF5.6-like [Ipomoea trifida]
MQSMNSDFFYAVDVSEDDRLKNFLWVDAKSRHDYAHFSDVVSFDATSATLSWVMRTWLIAMGGEAPKAIVTDHEQAMTSNEEEFMVKFEECIYRPWTDDELEERNKYKIPHYEFVSLGTTLLSDESSATLSWVMRTWLRAMGGSSESVKNIVKQNEEEFMVKFEECIYRPWTDDELEERNKYKIPHYEFVSLGTTLLSDESSATLSWVMRTWLRAMGGEAPKAIVTDHEQAMTSMQSMNSNFFYAVDVSEDHRLKNFLWVDAKSRHDYPHFSDIVSFDATSATLSWVMRTWLRAMGGEAPKAIVTDHEQAMTSNEEEFMVKFEECIYRPWTDEELEERFEEEAWNEQPVLKSSSPFEKHMAGVYTHSVFKKFQIEVVGVVACICVSQKQDEKGSISYRIQDFMVTLNEEKAESYDTKFRYFNNYNVNQPRYYCRTCRRHWTHGGAQHDIPRGGRSHKGKRSTRRHENQRIQLAPPSLPQLQPLNPSTIVAPPPFISPMVPPMMTPYHVSGGFFPPMVEEEIPQTQQCEAGSGYLNWVNPLNIVDQSFPQLTNRHSDSCMESYRLNNNEASSSNVVPLDASMGKISTTNGGTNVSWDSSFVDLDK